MTEENYIWIFTGTTESGDDVGPYAFTSEPTTAELQQILMAEWPSEFEMDKEDWIDDDFGYISSSSLEKVLINVNE